MPNFFKNISFDLLSVNDNSFEVTPDFNLNESSQDKKKILIPAAVLITIYNSPSGPTVIFTRRALGLKNHPGQISFPGGRVERIDESELSAALREAEEEIGLDSSKTTILGRLPSHETSTGFIVTPFICIIEEISHLRPNLSEVREIFEVPLNFLLNKKNMNIHKLVINCKEKGYYAIPYGPYYIWGATAHIVKTFADWSQIDVN